VGTNKAGINRGEKRGGKTGKGNPKKRGGGLVAIMCVVVHQQSEYKDKAG